MNKLYYGDNLAIMQRLPLQSVDLIYLDPPFNSQQSYNMIYRRMTGLPVPEQADAFCDTWTLDAEKREIAKTMPVLMRDRGVDDFYINFWRLWMDALRNSQPQLLAYLTYMVHRLLYMKTLLRRTGSVYLHCDPTVSHYIKIMMDGIFGHRNFRNEIIWKRTGAHGRAKRWGPIHDVILYYTMSDDYTWNRVFEDYDQSYIDKFYRQSDDHGRYQLITLDGPGERHGSSGLPWRTVSPSKGRHWELPPDRALPDWFIHPPGYSDMTVQDRLDVLDTAGLIYWPKKGNNPRFKRYLDVAEGNPIQDIVTDIRPIGSHADERLGFPTQKPISLLDRIILASSNPGDTVFDPFCGCGTTIYSAVKNERQWIGCDIAILAIRLVMDILGAEPYNLSEGTNYEVDGVPASAEQAEELFKRSPIDFEHWAVEKLGGFPTSASGDRGIDGRIWFHIGTDSGKGRTGTALKSAVISVKGGNIRPQDVRELRGVLEREDSAEIGAFVSIKSHTKSMKNEAADAGLYEYDGVKYHRLQLLTVEDMFAQKKGVSCPTTRVFSRVPKGQQLLPLGSDD